MGGWHASCKESSVASIPLVVAILAAVVTRPGFAQPRPGPGAPVPPDVAVPRHLAHVADHLRDASPGDDLGRRTLGEAKVSFAAATADVASGKLSAADQLAASADDLIHASGGEPPPRGLPRAPDDAALVLDRVDLMSSALSSLRSTRVRTLLALAQNVAGTARREAAAGTPEAARDARRAEAIARAAVHVALAEDPTLSPALLPPPPHPPKHGPGDGP